MLDEEGYLTVVDQIEDMIKTGGESVASEGRLVAGQPVAHGSGGIAR